MTKQPAQTDQPDEPYTIEDCLRLADDYLRLADEGEMLEPAVGHAAIAAAFAQVATAKMAYKEHEVSMMRHQLWIDNTFGEVPDDEFDGIIADLNEHEFS